MLSVWSKIDKRSVVGQQMERDGFYIPDTDWIDFFNPEAAAAYWKNFKERLLPLGIDAWWMTSKGVASTKDFGAVNRYVTSIPYSSVRPFTTVLWRLVVSR